MTEAGQRRAAHQALVVAVDLRSSGAPTKLCDTNSRLLKSFQKLGRRLTVRLQTLDLRIGVRIPASQP